MAQEWYLMSSSTKPNSLGGYENEGFNDFKDDAFDEALATDIARTVTLYNYDLSQSVETRCIVQGNISDTQDKSMARTVLFKRGTVKAGMYIYVGKMLPAKLLSVGATKHRLQNMELAKIEIVFFYCHRIHSC